MTRKCVSQCLKGSSQEELQRCGHGEHWDKGHPIFMCLKHFTSMYFWVDKYPRVSKASLVSGPRKVFFNDLTSIRTVVWGPQLLFCCFQSL